jgi:ubiquinone/menaquinone biosynthesis C-methylase UbiE
MAKASKFYTELAEWWPLISPKEDYEKEAEFYTTIFKNAKVKSLLELGAGGGNNAYYLKKDFDMVLTDISSEMLQVSKKLNPECKHFEGDMRNLQLHNTFDGVFIHDAITYITNEKDLKTVFETAYKHLKPEGIALVAPDCTKETFKEGTQYEGHDSDQNSKAVRYIEWITDPDPEDTVYNYDIIFALREGKSLRTVVERQLAGVFPRQKWLDLLDQVGFAAKAIPDRSVDSGSERSEVFVGYRR